MLERKNKSQAGLWYMCWLCREMNKECIFLKSKLIWANHRQQDSQLKQFEVLKNYFYLFSALQEEEQDDESLVQWIFESSPGCLLFQHRVKIIPGAMNADDFFGCIDISRQLVSFFLKDGTSLYCQKEKQCYLWHILGEMVLFRCRDNHDGVGYWRMNVPMQNETLK